MSFLSYWYVWVGLALLMVVPIIQRLIQGFMDERRYARAGLADVHRMHWRDFEKYLGNLFESLGYRVEVTPASGDNGVDVLLTDRNGRRTAVQAKHWRGTKVGSPEVQRTVGGAVYYKCETIIVVTLAGYTDQAREFARGTGVQLWSLEELGDAMERARSAGPTTQPSAIAAAGKSSRVAAPPLPKPAAAKPLGMPVTPTTPTGPACAQCGRPMVGRTAMGRKIWICSRFPTCNGSKMMD